MIPTMFEHDGMIFAATAKTGRRISTGENASEYEAIEQPGLRVWMTEAGEVYPD